MDVPATLTTNGRLTIPAPVREALGLKAGDRVIFRVEESRAMLAKAPDFLAMAGSVPVPAGSRGLSWDEVRRQSRAARTRRWA